jgi:hypothetical protein
MVNDELAYPNATRVNDESAGQKVNDELAEKSKR